MTKRLLLCAIIFVLCSVFSHAEIIADWDFAKADMPNGKYKIILRGNSAIADGCLTVPIDDVRVGSGAYTDKIYPELSPQKAFSVTISFQLDSAYIDSRSANSILLDNKYVAFPNEAQAKYHSGFQLALERYPKFNDCFRPSICLGYGNESLKVHGEFSTLSLDKPHTLKMVFTANGKVRFSFDGNDFEDVSVRPGSLAPAVNGLSIGDRTGSNYSPFGGKIFRVILAEEEFQTIAVSSDTMFRRVFERGESAPAYHALIYNGSNETINNLILSATSGKMDLGQTRIEKILPNDNISVPVKFNPWLLPGKYPIDLKLSDANGKIIATDKCSFFLAPEYDDFFPVILWGEANREDAKSIGFTHQACYTIPNTGDFTKELIPSVIADLDANLKAGLYSYGAIDGVYRFDRAKRYLRKDKNGQPYARAQVEASNPAVLEEFTDIAEKSAKYVGDHPGYDLFQSCSEVRDSSNVSFGGGESVRFKEYSGFDIPANITGKYPNSYESIPGAPWDKILAHDMPDLVFYRWFWKEGDGWNNVHTSISNAMHKHIKHHFRTYYDPSVRVPPLWNSGGNVDILSQWTYTYPDPIKIGQATDETMAMSQGNPKQKIMAMTQAIWYRSVTAPKPMKVSNPPEWISREGDAEYISIAPDFLREAIWSKISRRIDGIMYHGSGSLVAPEKHGYRFTNSESRVALQDMSQKVLQPLGRLIPKIPEYKPEVAILESFTSCLFNPYAFPMGWSKGWITDLHMALQWAHMQPAIVFEENLQNEVNTENLKVLFVPQLEVVTDTLLAKIQELQDAGVIIIGDEFTNNAIMPDIRIQSVLRKNSDPKGCKDELQKLGREIAEMLAPYYKSGMDASNQDIVLRRRGTEDAEYVFVLNDKRTFGDYVGQWGYVMEKGLENKGSFAVKYPAAAAYDLKKHEKLDIRYINGMATFDTSLAPADGQMIMLLKNPINDISSDTPSEITIGAAFKISAKWSDASGRAIKAFIPVMVTITGADGNELPGSGYHVADNGILEINQVAAPNMPQGSGTIEITCLATGQKITRKFTTK